MVFLLIYVRGMTYLKIRGKIRGDMGFSQVSLFSLAETPLNIGLNACVQS